MKNRLLSVLLILTLSLFAVSAGIAAPILSRTFYKLHVSALHLPETTGWTEGQIIDAYDDVMDFLLRDGSFGTGVLKWSEAGKEHFTDVRGLFRLDLWIFGVTGILLIILLIVSLKIRPYRFKNKGPSFWAGSGVLAAFLVIGGLGGAVCEAVAEMGTPCKVKRLGVPDLFPGFGSFQEQMDHLGYGIEAMKKALKEM